jgi:hypothetical protein
VCSYFSGPKFESYTNIAWCRKINNVPAMFLFAFFSLSTLAQVRMCDTLYDI